MNKELLAQLTMWAVCEGGSRGQKSSDALARLLFSILSNHANRRHC